MSRLILPNPSREIILRRERGQGRIQFPFSADHEQDWHQTSLLHIESNLDRLGMLSPTHDQRSQQKTGKITLQPVLINKSKFLKATHFVQK